MAVHVSSKMSGERWCYSKEHSSYFHNKPEKLNKLKTIKMIWNQFHEISGPCCSVL